MTKAEVVNEISNSTGIYRTSVLETVELFMDIVKESLAKGESVYLRGFGSFVVKTQAKKIARDINNNTPIIVPERKVPCFKPSDEFKNMVK